MMAKKKLTKQMQIFVVQQLAMFERPNEVRKLLSENFGVEIALPSILNYDISNPKLAKNWKELFQKTRNDFIEKVNDIAIANKAFRLRELNTLYHTQKQSKLQNPVEMRSILEQGAKESGDAYTNKRDINIKKIDVSNLSDEELSAIVED